MDRLDDGAEMRLDFGPEPFPVSGVVQLALPKCLFEETDMGASRPVHLPVMLLLRGVKGKCN
ncbi:hypothetical protein D3C86_2230080 [compost metagenome]